MCISSKKVKALATIPGRDAIPNFGRGALHKCLQHHGISRLPAAEVGETDMRFKTYDKVYIHIDSSELQHVGGNRSCSRRLTGYQSSPASQSTAGNGMDFTPKASVVICQRLLA